MSKNYTPTGFPLGRPRMGDIRPLTPKTIAARKYRAGNIEQVRESTRAAVAAWRQKDPVHARKVMKSSKIRNEAYVKWIDTDGTNKKLSVTVDFKIIPG